MYLFLAVLGLACCEVFSVAVASMVCFSVWCSGLSLRWLLCAAEPTAQTLGRVDFRGSAQGLNSCSSPALEHRFNIWAYRLSCLRHVGSSQTRERIRVSCMAGGLAGGFFTLSHHGSP